MLRIDRSCRLYCHRADPDAFAAFGLHSDDQQWDVAPGTENSADPRMEALAAEPCSTDRCASSARQLDARRDPRGTSDAVLQELTSEAWVG